MITSVLKAGQWCFHRLQSNGPGQGWWYQQIQEINPDKTRQRVSLSRKTRQKWQETGLEAGLEIRLYVSWVQTPAYKSRQEGRTVGSRTCVLKRHMGRWGCRDHSLNAAHKSIGRSQAKFSTHMAFWCLLGPSNSHYNVVTHHPHTSCIRREVSDYL